MSDESELFRAIGRIERTVDTIDTKLDGHAEAIARHDERIRRLEQGAQRGWERAVLWITVLAALIAAVLPLAVHQ